MRFYRIEITDSSGIPVNLGSGLPMLATWTSFLTGSGSYTPGLIGANGLTDPGALNIEMDIPVVSEDIPSGQGYLKIWGISLDMVNNASKLNYKNITIYAGFQKGLPLANAQILASPIRNGIIFKGSIYQAFGNWQGNEQTIEMFLGPQLSPNTKPGQNTPLILTCPIGADYGNSIQNALQLAGITVDSLSISPLLSTAILPAFGSHTTLFDFATAIKSASKAALSFVPGYDGIKIIRKHPNSVTNLPVVIVTDNAAPPTSIPVNIHFSDLIGQPVWLDFNTLQFKLMMRSDISIGMQINFPTAAIFAVNTAQSESQFKNGIAYSGSAYVNAVRYVGNFRQETGDSWITIVDCFPNQQNLS